METLTDCEMVSAFSAFLLGLINSETQAALKLGLEKTELDFPLLWKLMGFQNMSYGLRSSLTGGERFHNGTSHVTPANGASDTAQ